jgi:hypothetical protein
LKNINKIKKIILLISLQKKDIPFPPNCSALAFSIPFWAALPVGSSPAQLEFEQHILLVAAQNNKVDKSNGMAFNDLPNICRPENGRNIWRI